MRISDSGGGWSATTNFEQYSHAQLVNMVNGSAPTSISSIATTLNAAGTQIQSMADDLNTHLTNLQWDGAAGDSFRTWGRQVVQAMDDLAIFHGNAGLAVQTAGDTLSSVKAGMPPVPTADVNLVNAYVQQESCKVSTPPVVVNGRVQPPTTCLASLPGQISQTDAYAAQSRVDTAHQEAISQMEKLGGAYNGATQTMDINSEPQFPPPPDGMLPPRGSGKEGMVNVPGPNGNGGGGGGGTVQPPSSHGGGGVQRQPIGGGGVHQAPPPPGQSGGVSTLQGTHAPTAGPSPVTAPKTPGGTSTGHGPGGGPIPGAGPGIFTSPGAGRGKGRGDFGKGELPPGEHPGEPGIGGGIGRGGLGGGKAGRLGGAGSDIGGGLGGGSAEGKPGVVGGEGAGSSTARSALPAEETAGTGVAGEAAGKGASGQMMGGGGMGGLGRAGGRRSRSGRAAYLSEDEATWESHSTRNPAVIE